jgi:hypothetical protein
MKSEPKDLVFNEHGITLKFAAWYMAYNKGANAGIQIIINTEAGDARDVSPNDLFGHKTHATIHVQELMSGMTYKDLIDLSKWAAKSAEFLKETEIQYSGQKEFNKKHQVNELKVQEIPT